MSSNTQSTGRGNTGNGNGKNAGKGNSGSNGNRKGNGSNNNKQNGKTNQKQKKFHPLSRGKTPDYSFEEVKKALIDKMSTMKMDYIDDMITSVRDMSLVEIDTLEPTLTLAPDNDL